MCGRFERKTKADIVSEILSILNSIDEIRCAEIRIGQLKEINIAPTNKIISLNNGNGIVLSINSWGIKFGEKSPLIFNSRIETIKEKAYWKRLYTNNRCIVPMTAFYEWQKVKTKKQPYKIFLPKQKLFFVAGLYHLDKDKQKYISLITTPPNDFMKDIHNRMPVILKKEHVLNYLHDKEADLDYCIPYEGEMDCESIDNSYLSGAR